YNLPEKNQEFIIPDDIYTGLEALAKRKLELKKTGNLENTLTGHLGEYALYKLFYPYSTLVPECLISLYKNKPLDDRGDFIVDGVQIDVKSRVKRDSMLLSFGEMEKNNGIDIFVLLNRIDDRTFIYRGCFPKKMASEKHIRYIPQRGRRYEILKDQLICLKDY